ncbi:MAG: hypothetical protein JRJ39_13370 [Deltaproteobacteria bacterium]|nr:hypothetical protein [Deltaproteobacteria bacterium]MBW1814614.1 hypothetical protein [Deltaproteobacteria bacterium]MBW1845769.1 hypothetical protein [Deltaproteobacteria bacterium]MBW1983346.1 hypothetical protein [Deltaproteobacteria bacterium]
MADIISLDEKIQLTKEKTADLIKKRKISAIRKSFHCAHCMSKCEKCGTQVNLKNYGTKNDIYNLRVPYRFCDTCSDEYINYIGHLKGNRDLDCYWHNAEWLDSWRKWIDYQASVDRYLKSKEFTKLIKEAEHSQEE